MKTLNVAFDVYGGFKRDNIFKGWEGFGGIKHFREACQGAGECGVRWWRLTRQGEELPGDRTVDAWAHPP